VAPALQRDSLIVRYALSELIDSLRNRAAPINIGLHTLGMQSKDPGALGWIAAALQWKGIAKHWVRPIDAYDGITKQVRGAVANIDHVGMTHTHRSPSIQCFALLWGMALVRLVLVSR
jgi:hypothetical protein